MKNYIQPLTLITESDLLLPVAIPKEDWKLLKSVLQWIEKNFKIEEGIDCWIIHEKIKPQQLDLFSNQPVTELNEKLIEILKQTRVRFYSNYESEPAQYEIQIATSRPSEACNFFSKLITKINELDALSPLELIPISCDKRVTKSAQKTTIVTYKVRHIIPRLNDEQLTMALGQIAKSILKVNLGERPGFTYFKFIKLEKV